MIELPAPLMTALAAGALVPALRSLLLFDADPLTMRAAAQTAAAMLRRVSGRPAQIVPLAYVQSEEALWGGLDIQRRPGGALIGWQPGLLTGELGAGSRRRPLPVVVIPDLPRLGLAAQRACVALIGAEEAVLERHGHSAAWQPEIFWIAACARAEVGQLSAHLLDRFMLRLNARPLDQARREEALRAELAAERRRAAAPGRRRPPSAKLPTAWRERIDLARATHPQIGEEDLAEALRYFPPDAPPPGMRRPLALVHLGFALAALGGAPELTARHIEGAAKVLGLRRHADPAAPAPAEPAPAEPAPAQISPVEEPSATEPQAPAEPIAAPGAPIAAPELAADDDLIFAPDTTVSAEAALSPFPEDERPPEHQSEALRTPGRRHSERPSASGPQIGVEPTSGTTDLAVVSTLIEAAKYQHLRRTQLREAPPEQQPPPGAMILRLSDLRRYRRAPVVEQLLLLLVDHTSLAGCDWAPALMEHIMWAYQERAAVTLIQVGAAATPNEYRAHALSVANVMVPALDSALVARAGRATPLAHGLELVLQTLRRATQSGRNAVQRVRLVLLTDGRGNVALEDSLAGAPRRSAGRQGIDDALAIAPAIARVGHTQRVLLNPQPRHLRDLPLRLAAALGARALALPRLDEDRGGL